MEAVIFIGLQGAGKSTFYKERFFNTHVRINLDMLKTRNRERILLEACLAAKQPFVLDNTNPLPEERARYIQAAQGSGFRVVGYYFRSAVSECIARNNQRFDKARVPAAAIYGTAKKMQAPALSEGFAALYYVQINQQGQFVVEEWQQESLTQE